MKKIISILILILITLTFAQTALASYVENCQECCTPSSYQDACETACNQTDPEPTIRVGECQKACITGIPEDLATEDDDFARSQCQSCCSSLGYTFTSPITKHQDITNLISKLTNWFQGIVLAIAIIMIIYGAIVYITSGGDEEKAGKAKKIIMYALIGIAVVLLAWGAEFLVLSFLS